VDQVEQTASRSSVEGGPGCPYGRCRRGT
jgi:hypothetical protein